jgi:hypothetical protein
MLAVFRIVLFSVDCLTEVLISLAVLCHNTREFGLALLLELPSAVSAATTI